MKDGDADDGPSPKKKEILVMKKVVFSTERERNGRRMMVMNREWKRRGSGL